MGYYVSAETIGSSDAERRDLEKHYYAPGLEGMLVLFPGVKSLLRFTFGNLDESANTEKGFSPESPQSPPST